MIPTKEQEQWFWEQCGFYWGEKILNGLPAFYDNQPSAKIMVWLHPDRHGGSPELPPIDLNNLFEYAVPEGCQQIIFQPDGYCGLTVNDNLFEDGGDTPADALFGAIYKALGGKE